MKSYLHNRRARVVIYNTKSKKILLRHGTEEYATTAKIRPTSCQDWCVKINKTKYFTTLFTLSTKSKPMKIMLDDTELQHTDSATYIGITFDKRQTWKHTSGKGSDAILLLHYKD